MKTDYYLQDSYFDRENLILVFFKDFYYNYAVGLSEGICKLTISKAEMDHLSEQALIQGDKYNFEILKRNSFEELLLKTEDGNELRIIGEQIKQKILSDSKEDLVQIIQQLENQLLNSNAQNVKDYKFIQEIQSLYTKQMEKALVVLKVADWLSESKRIEENTKIAVYKQILNLIENRDQARP